MLAKSTRATRLVAVITLIMGLGWVWFSLIDPLVRPHIQTDATSTRPIYIFMLLMVAVPGFLCIYFGIALLRQVCARYLKGAVGSLLAALIILLASTLAGSMSAGNVMVFSVFLFAGTMVILPVYLALCKALLRREGFVVPDGKELLGKTVVLLVALQIWWLSTHLISTYAPRQAEDPDLMVQPWPIVVVVAPILIAIVVYRATNALLGNTKPNPAPMPQE